MFGEDTRELRFELGGDEEAIAAQDLAEQRFDEFREMMRGPGDVRVPREVMFGAASYCLCLAVTILESCAKSHHDSHDVLEAITRATADAWTDAEKKRAN